MTRATLRNHFRTMMKHLERPTVVHSKKDVAVDEILIGGLQNEAYAKIEEYIGTEQHSKEMEEVEVVLEDDEQVNVSAYVYVWNGNWSGLEPRHWTPRDFVRGSTSPPSGEVEPES